MARQKIISADAARLDPGKTARVKQEKARLMELFSGADPNKLDFIRDAVQQVAWLGITILELQKDIDENGSVIPYQNGQTQKGLQANPACKLLIEYQKIYNTQFRALLPVLPNKTTGIGKLEEFRREFDLDLDLDNV